MNDSRRQLDELLSETPSSASTRESSAFDSAAENRHKVVIFGAGRLGRKILAGIAGSQLQAIAFVDNNSGLWGSSISDLPVLKPEEAAVRHACDAVFVVAIWHPSNSPLMSDVLIQLKNLGCRAVPFPLLFWKNPDRFLPYFFWERPSKLLNHSEDIREAFNYLEDDLSRQTFLAQLQLRLSADFDCPGLPVAREQYFPGIFSISADECFVDCGSYTGDTIQTFISQTRSSFRKVIAFEADAAVLPELEKSVSGIGDRAVLYRAAVGARKGTVQFASDGIGGGCVSGSAGVKVPSVRLDDALATEQVTFIKMDIEGAELQALEGGRQVIQRDRPVLAICGYHAPDHLWLVPRSLREIAPDSLLYLRSHCVDGLDTVCYSVPPERAIPIRTRFLNRSGLKRLSRRAKGAAL
jgi:FkbM family methyltransferase